MTIRRLLLAAALSLLAACANSGPRPVAGAYEANEAYTVTLPQAWTDMTSEAAPGPNVQLLTRPGARLYLAALRPGQRLADGAGAFAPDMTEDDLAALVAASFNAAPGPRRVMHFGTAPGVRFDLAAQSTRGAALIARVEDRLLAIVLLAPDAAAAAALAPEADQVFESVALRARRAR